MIPGNGGICVQKPTKTPVDILETDEKVHAIIRIPDMDMETIKLADSGKVLEISAQSGDNAVAETIELPAKVNKRFKAAYKNGILEIVFNKSRRHSDR